MAFVKKTHTNWPDESADSLWRAEEVNDLEDRIEAEFLAGGGVGPKGDKGDTGDTGPKGDTGDAGPAGAKGDKGDKGDTGATGPKGDKGDKGDTGDPGTVDIGPWKTVAADSENGWENGWDDIGETCRFRLEGDVLRFAGAATGADATDPVAFTLPSAFRPDTGPSMSVLMSDGTAIVPGYITVNLDGTVVIEGASPVAFASLSGVTVELT